MIYLSYRCFVALAGLEKGKNGCVLFTSSSSIKVLKNHPSKVPVPSKQLLPNKQKCGQAKVQMYSQNASLALHDGK